MSDTDGDTSTAMEDANTTLAPPTLTASEVEDVVAARVDAIAGQVADQVTQLRSELGLGK